MSSSAKRITTAGLVAAAYVVLTLVSSLVGLSSGIIQIRLSECLCVLPYFTPAAVAGLAIGCLISNLLCGGLVLDAIFGTLATLAAAIIALLISKYRKNRFIRYIVPVPNVVANTLVIPWVLKLVYGESGAIWYFTMTVGIGEIISAYILGILLFVTLEKYKNKLFR